MTGNNRNFVTLAVVFIVGLLIGWFVLGWLIAPVQWTGALMQDLAPEFQQMFYQTESEAYDLTKDLGTAQQRLQTLGSKDHVSEVASDAIFAAESSGDLVAADRMRRLSADLGLDAAVAPQQPAAEPGEAPPAAEETADRGLLPGICQAGLGIAVLLGGIALVLWLLTRGRRRTPAPARPASTMASTPPGAAPVMPGEWETVPPTPAPAAAAAATASDRAPVDQQFRAEFRQGDVSFDQSFDIDPGGVYLGECGMTISELINGDPNRVTALEVWLFDKSDIRTVTKVLMSDYAYGNQALRDKLSTRGDAVLLSPDLGFVLDAQTLRLEGKVVNLEYDDSDSAPRSSIRRVTVQLRVIRQNA